MSDSTSQQKLGVLDFLNMIDAGHPEYSLIAVKAPIEQVVPAFIEFCEAQQTKPRMDYKTFRNKELQITDRKIRWEQNITIQPRDLNNDEERNETDDSFEWGISFLQVNNSEWTVILRSLFYLHEAEINDVPREATALSAQLQTQAITLIEEDTSAAMGYRLYEHGEELEGFEAGDWIHFKSSLRERPAIFFDLDDEEDYYGAEQNRQYACSAAPEFNREQFVDELYRELGIYLPACYPLNLNGKPAIQVEPESADTIARADWLVIQETLQDNQTESEDEME